MAHQTRNRHPEESDSQNVGNKEGEKIFGMVHGREGEETRHAESHVGSHHHVDHEIAQSLAHHDAEDSIVMVGYRHKVGITVVLACGSCSKSDTQQ